MKLTALLTLCDSWVENNIPDEAKLFMINQIEGRVQVEGMRLDPSEIVQYAASDLEDEDLELLVPVPYDDLYVRWMIAQYYWYMGEYEVYQNEKAMFDSAWSRWLLYLCRTEHTGANEGRNPYDHP
jgi:hypothetical protein